MKMTLTKLEILEMYKDFSARFSNHLLRVLNEDTNRDSNISISPSRLQAVLVLLANWTSDDVKRQILDIVGSDVMDIREADTLCDKNRLEVTSWEDEERDFIPTIEQQAILWVMQGAKVKEAALQAVAPRYDLQMKRVDFAKEETTSLINETIEKATHGLIKELGIELDQETQMLITDILYFMAKWEDPFDEENTKEQLFYGTAGKKNVQMMKKNDCMLYQETEKCQIVNLTYMCLTKEERAFSMRIYLPKKGCSIDEVLREQWENEFTLCLEEEDVRLSLPKFTIETQVDFRKVFHRLGLDCIFESPDIIPQCMPNMQIQQIAQQVKIIVNETETEAAAVTSFCAAGCPPPEIEKKPITMTVNRPFLFEIVEGFSNTILFTGIINNIDEIF